MKSEPTSTWLAAVSTALVQWGPPHFQCFPWRDEDIPAWQGLIAEVLLQRTRASQVADVFKEFQRRYPSPDALGAAEAGELADLIRPLGLAWRAPLLHRLAKCISTAGGVVPEALDELLLLPGVGPYAAAATRSLHLDKRAVLIDSNIVRVLARLVGQPFGPETRRARWLRDLAASLTPAAAHRTYNYALLDLAMTVCTPRAPHCSDCPLASWCTLALTQPARPG